LKRKDKKSRKFSDGFESLIQEMDSARKILDELPDDQEFTMDDTDIVDELRLSAGYLKDVANAVLEEFQGKPNDQT